MIRDAAATVLRQIGRGGHLTTRDEHPLKPTQAQTAVAAALLRQLHAMFTTGQVWDPAIATHGTRRTLVEVPTAA